MSDETHVTQYGLFCVWVGLIESTPDNRSHAWKNATSGGDMCLLDPCSVVSGGQRHVWANELRWKNPTCARCAVLTDEARESALVHEATTTLAHIKLHHSLFL